MSQVATKPGTISAYQPRHPTDEAARAGKLQVLLLMGSELALSLDLAGLIVATFATIGAMTGIGAGLVVSRLGARRSLIGGMGVITLGNVIGASARDQLVLLVA